MSAVAKAPRPARPGPPAAPLGADAAGLRRRAVVTPEGVPLTFEVAQAGDRLGAFVLDFLLINLLTLLVAAPAIWLGAHGALSGDLVLAVVLLAVFLIRTFYFAFFELS